MYEFVLFSRKGHTNGRFSNLVAGGRLDIVYQCILTSIFRSHSHRHDVKFHAFLSGPPNPPIHLWVDGDSVFDVRSDERTWEKVFRKVLDGGVHPGIAVKKESIQAFVRSRAEKGVDIFILEERGKDISKIEFGDSAVFILGDHIGLPKKDEKFLLKFGEKISLGKQRYLAASCIDITNYNLDLYVLKKYGVKR
jgi:tRNA pseudouridine-54 N-methylase